MRSKLLAACLLACGVLGGCVAPAPPEPASARTSPPPWPAPRDGVSYIDAAKLQRLPLNDTSDPHVIIMSIFVNGKPVEVAPYIGIDRVRAWQAPVHTHDNSGQVWLEGAGNRSVTLAQFFTVWGVRFTKQCLGNVCGTVTVSVDKKPVPAGHDVVLRSVSNTIVIRVNG